MLLRQQAAGSRQQAAGSRQQAAGKENTMNITLDNIKDLFPSDFSADEKAKAQTMFFKELSLLMHEFYGGKMQTFPKAGVWGSQWFNVWYTPGVSAVSTAIRDDITTSYKYANRANTVAVVSDSTRVLGDGDCGIAGGLGVMEGKAFLMKYLAGIDASALCINSRDLDGTPNPKKIIEFVKMVEPSFGAVNLEDISKPNCYEVLDTLREACNIPVWHDDAQGTACVILAGMINALKLAGKEISSSRFVLLGAGAANTSIARFLILAGADPKNIILFNSRGALHIGRKDIEDDKREYQQWNLCKITNPDKITDMEVALKGADAIIALSKPGPDTIKADWIKLMADKPIVFACANPVPEIYPHVAKAAGAYIVATGRGDFPNQVNNSVCFPGILKGALLAHASKITDKMAIRASYAIASFAEKRGISPDNIVPTMDEIGVFPLEAAEVAMQAKEDGVAGVQINADEVYQKTESDIKEVRKAIDVCVREGLIVPPPAELLEKALAKAIGR